VVVWDKPTLMPGARTEEERFFPLWFNPCGATALCLVASGLYTIPLVGIRSLVLATSGSGLALVVLGYVMTAGKRQREDQVWLSCAGLLNSIVLLLVLFDPGLLNPVWAMDVAVPTPDPNRMVVVDRDRPMDAGRLVAAEVWADAVSEAVVQHDVLLRIDEVKIGPLRDKGATAFLQIQYRIGNRNHGYRLEFDEFSANRPPVLTDEQGRGYKFVDHWTRKMGVGPPMYFEPLPPRTVLIPNTGHANYLLLFEAPRVPMPPMKLVLSATAWGRQGECRFRIVKEFVAPIPELPK